MHSSGKGLRAASHGDSALARAACYSADLEALILRSRSDAAAASLIASVPISLRIFRKLTVCVAYSDFPIQPMVAQLPAQRAYRIVLR